MVRRITATGTGTMVRTGAIGITTATTVAGTTAVDTIVGGTPAIGTIDPELKRRNFCFECLGVSLRLGPRQNHGTGI